MNADMKCTEQVSEAIDLDLEMQNFTKVHGNFFCV